MFRGDPSLGDIVEVAKAVRVALPRLLENVGQWLKGTELRGVAHALANPWDDCCMCRYYNLLLCSPRLL